RWQAPYGRRVVRPQHEVGATGEGSMLEAVVEHDRVEGEARAGERGRLVAALAGHDGTRETARQHHRLVAAVLRRDERPTLHAHDDRAGTPLAVAARHDADAVPTRR